MYHSYFDYRSKNDKEYLKATFYINEPKHSGEKRRGGWDMFKEIRVCFEFGRKKNDEYLTKRTKLRWSKDVGTKVFDPESVLMNKD